MNYGTMEDFTLTGRIEIEGPSELFTDNFSWLLTPKRAFPDFSTNVTGLPLSAELVMGSTEYNLPLSGYTGVVVDGLEVEFEMENFRMGAGNVLLDQVPEPGDFNGNGIVDGEDFHLWQLDPSVGSLADWENNYGMIATLTATSATVPEPTTCTLALAALCLAIGRRR